MAKLPYCCRNSMARRLGQPPTVQFRLVDMETAQAGSGNPTELHCTYMRRGGFTQLFPYIRNYYRV
jgi:hypothetical protein